MHSSTTRKNVLSIVKMCKLHLLSTKQLLVPCIFALLVTSGCEGTVKIERPEGDFSIEMRQDDEDGVSDSKPSEISISIDASGAYLSNNQTLKESEVEDLILAAVSKNSSVALTVSRDESGPYKALVDLLGIAARFGVNEIEVE